MMRPCSKVALPTFVSALSRPKAKHVALLSLLTALSMRRSSVMRMRTMRIVLFMDSCRDTSS